jgi:branched-subunit amino acid ABC-type transport system permease component
MISQTTPSIAQILSLLVVNFIGIALIGLIIILFRLMPKKPNKKVILSIGVSLIMQGILLIAFLDVGIYLWINSGNFRAVFSVLPLSLCIAPILIPVTAIGTYIQLSYGEKIRDYTKSIARKKFSE